MKKVSICGDFNAPHQELNCTYNTEKGDKIIETIETRTFKLLSNGYHRYQSNQGECRNTFDLHFTDQLVFKFFDTFYVSDDFGSNHSSTITTLNIVIQSRFDLKAKINFKKFNQILRQEYENSALCPPFYPKAEEINNLNEVFEQIIQFSLQKSYILQKIFPFGYETTKLIRENEKKRSDLKRTNGEQLKFLKMEINFLQREIKRSMKRSEKIKQSKLIASAQNKGSKSFWRAVKAFCINSKKPMKLNKVLKSHINKSEQKKDIEKSEILKTPLQDTMKDHIHENLELNEHFEKVENETKTFLQCKILNQITTVL